VWSLPQSETPYDVMNHLGSTFSHDVSVYRRILAAWDSHDATTWPSHGWNPVVQVTCRYFTAAWHDHGTSGMQICHSGATSLRVAQPVHVSQWVWVWVLCSWLIPPWQPSFQWPLAHLTVPLSSRQKIFQSATGTGQLPIARDPTNRHNGHGAHP
jgi:hypothetical protein